MTDDDPTTNGKRILGTRVPDTPIHRASMWLEEFRFGDRREEAETETMEDGYWQKFIQETGLLNLTDDDISEAAHYYGINNLRMLTGGRINVLIPSPTGEGHIDLAGIFVSLWADAFCHGVATKAGKVGLSNEEKRKEARRQERATMPPVVDPQMMARAEVPDEPDHE